MGTLTTGGLQSLRYDAEKREWTTKSDALKARVETPGKPERARTPLSDGDGLYLHLTPAGSAIWRIEYRYKGIRKSYTAGPYINGLSLAEAREAAVQVKKWIREGIDPSAAKRKGGRGEAFRSVALEFFARKTTRLNAAYRERVLRRLEKHVFPKIGKTAIAEIETQDLFRLYKNIEKKGFGELAHRIAGLVDRICEYARLTGRIPANPAARLSSALAPASHAHRPAILDADGIGEMLRRIENYPGSEALRNLLKIAPYVFLRSREIRLATWEEIDLENGLWIVPAEHMKMGREHIVPLSTQVISILKEIPRVSGLIFPGRTGGPISRNGLALSIRYLGYGKGQMCFHGFRSIASTVLNEHGWRPDVVEMQLSHIDQNAVRAAYNRASYLPERKQMMQWYADFLDAARSNRLLALV